MLKHYGYATAAFGKWHNTPANETTIAGPLEELTGPQTSFHRVLLRVLGGEASQYEPNLVRNTTRIHAA